VDFFGLLTPLPLPLPPPPPSFRCREVSFLRHQRRRGSVKPTHRPIRMFSLPFGALGAVCNFAALFTTLQ